MGTAIDVLDILDLNESSPRKSMLDREAILSRAEKVSTNYFDFKCY